MAFPNLTLLSAGDRGSGAGYRSPYGDLNPSALAWAMVSGDSVLVARPDASAPGPPRQAVRPSVRPDRRRLHGGGRGRSRSRGRQGRFSPYAIPGVKLDLLRTVLQQRLLASGRDVTARVSA
uniref:uncharacterized protein C11orf71 homolog n=1 Tax=Jaculus jaculus TaxID=51337 RepID=UPI001E1AF84B|nr:uncharacterized protein C11orf71 homolog [Jaculus jaculus]